MKVTVFGSIMLDLYLVFVSPRWVICHLVDVDAARIEKLQLGESPIYEPGLDTLLADNWQRPSSFWFGS